MSHDRPWTAKQLGRALQAQKLRIEAERRAQFSAFNVAEDCLWPASQVYHKHSMLGPAWTPALTDGEVEALTLDLAYKRYPNSPQIALPRPPTFGADLQATMRRRETERDFGPGGLSLNDLVAMLHLGGGITRAGDVPHRAAPSPGALYPIELYPIVFCVSGLSPGVYHYATLSHELEMIRPITGVEATKPFLPGHFFSAEPALIIAMTAIFARVQMKYVERGYRFALLEAGHIAQNMLLAATALNIAAAPIGGFWDEPFNDLLQLDPSHEAVVYSVVAGAKP